MIFTWNPPGSWLTFTTNGDADRHWETAAECLGKRARATFWQMEWAYLSRWAHNYINVLCKLILHCTYSIVWLATIPGDNWFQWLFHTYLLTLWGFVFLLCFISVFVMAWPPGSSEIESKRTKKKWCVIFEGNGFTFL